MGGVGIVALEIRNNVLVLLAFLGKILGVEQMVTQFLAHRMIELL
jgi:hypothetical protein